MVSALPAFAKKSSHVLSHWNDSGPTPLRTRTAFAAQWVRPHEDGVYFLSNHSGIYYYLTDTLRPIEVPVI